MLYGAYGTTGLLILDYALRRGHRPLLAGRDPARLSALASKTGLDFVALSLDSSEPPGRALAGVSAVMNAAGPFFETGRPLRKHSLEAGVSYIDVNGEIGDFLQAMDCDAQARKRGIAIIPGAGFGVVFGEAVAAHVIRRLPQANSLRLSLAAVNASTSDGAARSTAAVLAEGGYAVADGQLRRRPTAFETWRLASAENGQDTTRFAAAPRAEIVAAHRLTGVKNIVAGVPLSLAGALALRVAGRLIGSALLRKGSSKRAEKPVTQGVAEHHRSRVWAEARDAAGNRVASLLETGEGYQLAAAAAVHALEKMLALRPVGALTPAQAFGADFALSLPETHIRDL